MEYKTSNWQLLVYIILLSGLIYSKFKPKKKAENEPQNIYVNPKINPSFSPISGGPDNTAYSGGNCATHSGDTVPLIPVI